MENNNNKEIFIGMDLVEPNNPDSDIASICIIADGKTFYFEFNDCDLTKANTNLLNKLLFLNNEEPTLLYKSGERDITYCRDNREMAVEFLQNVLLMYCENKNVTLVGNITPYDFVSFTKLIGESELLKHINVTIDNNYINLVTLSKFLKLINLYEVDNLFDKVGHENDNIIIQTNLIMHIYSGLVEVKKS